MELSYSSPRIQNRLSRSLIWMLIVGRGTVPWAGHLGSRSRSAIPVQPLRPAGALYSPVGQKFSNRRGDSYGILQFLRRTTERRNQVLQQMRCRSFGRPQPRASTAPRPPPSQPPAGSSALKIILIIVGVIVLIGILGIAPSLSLACVWPGIAASLQEGDHVKVETPFGTAETSKDTEKTLPKNLGVDIYPERDVTERRRLERHLRSIRTVAAIFRAAIRSTKSATSTEQNFPNAIVSTSDQNRCTIVSNDPRNMITINVEPSGDGSKFKSPVFPTKRSKAPWHTIDSPIAPQTSCSTDAAALAAEALRAQVRGEVRFDNGSRALYATDGSNYRQVPIGVVLPRDTDDVSPPSPSAASSALPCSAAAAAPRLAGQCCNVAVVLDFSKYMAQILEIDPERRIARVQPGVVLDHLRDAAEKHHLTFGPDPATHNRCTIGGMIGNNSCGVHSVMAGKTDDNIEALDVLTYDGTRMRVGRPTSATRNWDASSPQRRIGAERKSTPA